MKNGTMIRQVVNLLNQIDFNASEDRHVFGDIYESILRNLQSAGNYGEFYTPRAITEIMTEIVNPRLGEKVLDPFCGSGTSCVAAKSLNRKYIGIDSNQDAVSLSNKRTQEMVISESNVLSNGINSYIEKNELELNTLSLLNAIPVQRNKGIDGFISVNDSLIPIKIGELASQVQRRDCLWRK